MTPMEHLNRMLAVMVSQGASDIYIRTGKPPYLRIEGEVMQLEMEPFAMEDMKELSRHLLQPEEQQNFRAKPEGNAVYFHEELGRFRLNMYLQQNMLAMVMRKIREDISDVESLGLPVKLEELAMLRSGLVLITGSTGSGKSTTLASMVKYRNTYSTGHILTIEDPVEFMHEDINCIISQREVGIDTKSFSDALESAVRQAPDVLLIGEMRDRESVQAALDFAETGHLVLGTIHSNNAVQTIERLLQFYPKEAHDQVLHALSTNLKAVFSQRLLKAKDSETRIPAYEMMIVNARFRDLLAKANYGQINKELDQFYSDGMISFDSSMISLLKRNLVTLESCLKMSDNPHDLKLKLKSLGMKV